MLDDLHSESFDEKKPNAARDMDLEKLDKDFFRDGSLNIPVLADCS